MKCKKCGSEDKWTHSEYYPTTGHPNVETKLRVCECGHEQEDFEDEY